MCSIFCGMGITKNKKISISQSTVTGLTLYDGKDIRIAIAFDEDDMLIITVIEIAQKGK
jgi:hypothetical protein